MSVLAHLERHARTIGYRPAVRTADSVWSFGKLWDRTERIATALRHGGVERGQMVAVVGDNTAEYLASFFGTLLAGAVVVPVNTRLTAAELAVQLDLADATTVLFTDDGHELIREGLKATIPCLSTTDLDVAADGLNPLPRPEDIALCVMTTGSTGAPKGVVHTHGSLEHAAVQLTEMLPIEPDEISLSFLPFNASIPEHALPVLLAGGSLMLVRRYSLEGVIAGCAHATSFHAVPTIVGRLLADGDHDVLRRLRWISFASEPMPLSLLERWWAAFPDMPTHQFYGMSEVLPITFASSDVMRASPGTVGIAFPATHVQVVDSDLEPVGVGVEGEVVCATPAQMLHYLGRPDLTTAALTPGGAMRTGDLGSLDADGRLHLTGRIKDVIISGGLNIAPADIELVASRFPGVDVAAAIGVPSPEWGETPVLLVVPMPGVQIDLVGLMDHCRRELAGFKRPSAIGQVAELPIIGIGKTDKALLRAWLADGALDLVTADAGRIATASRP